MPVSRIELLRWQFDFNWLLFDLHLEQLEPADFLWEPATYCWTLHPAPDGGWFPDWEETEPDPIPIPTIEWLRRLRQEWVAVLDGLTEDELDIPAPFPWSDDPEKTVAHMAGWVNAELMKNVAEIGQLRLLRNASG